VIGALLLAPVTATAGAVAGALMARPAAEVEAEEKQFASALAQRDAQACLRKQVAAYASDWTGNTVPVIPERGPKTAAGGADYSDLDAAQDLTILEVVVETLAIDGWGIRSPRTTLFVVARTRLLRGRDGAELYGSRIVFHSRERPWRQWTPTGLADELDRACDLLAERISDEVFALYVPTIWQQR
jgi:hypothetical protein